MTLDHGSYVRTLQDLRAHGLHATVRALGMWAFGFWHVARGAFKRSLALQCLRMRWLELHVCRCI